RRCQQRLAPPMHHRLTQHHGEVRARNDRVDPKGEHEPEKLEPGKYHPESPPRELRKWVHHPRAQSNASRTKPPCPFGKTEAQVARKPRRRTSAADQSVTRSRSEIAAAARQ